MRASPRLAVLVLAAASCDAPPPPSTVPATPSTPAAVTPPAPEPPPSSGPFSPARLIALGGANLCIVAADGAVRCVGEWPLKYETATTSGARNQYIHTPIPVTDAGDPVALTVGIDRACGVLADGGVRCWGNNRPSRNGWFGAREGVLTAEPVAGLPPAVAVALTWTESCALGRDGSITCWGPVRSNAGRQTGPVDPPRTLTIADSIQIDGAHDHFCALRSSGLVTCWGDNREGQLDGKPGSDEHPRDVPGLRDVDEIAVGPTHNCARTRTDEVWCWGANRNGQLGDRSEDPRTAPVRVPGLAAATIAASDGSDLTCALTRAGAVACWGEDSNCTLGDRHDHNCRVRTMQSSFGPSEHKYCLSPQPIDLPITPVALSLGTSTACARDASGQIACWGRSLTGGTTTCRGEPT